MTISQIEKMIKSVGSPSQYNITSNDRKIWTSIQNSKYEGTEQDIRQSLKHAKEEIISIVSNNWSTSYQNLTKLALFNNVASALVNARSDVIKSCNEYKKRIDKPLKEDLTKGIKKSI